jgi:hypothetical protein
MTTTGTDTREDQLLAAVEATRAVITAHEVDLLRHATEWVALHPGTDVDTSIEFGMRELQIAGDGAPTIDEGAIAEFALAVGMTTDSAAMYLGDAVELRHRLPRIWARVVAGEVPVWKARKIAQATTSLPLDGAHAVDRALHFVAKRCSYAEIGRQVERARKEHDPAQTERRRRAALDARRVRIGLREATEGGLVHLDATLDPADALDLETAIADIAAGLDTALPLDVRRSIALGILAAEHNSGGADDGTGRTVREVVIYAHARTEQAMVDVENTRTVVTPDQVREWCQTAGTKVTVKPVIDLNTELSTEVHDPTETMKEQARLRYRECCFPGCHRPARSADTDHIIAWPIGPTTSSNLAPLCRGHHRLKTHTRWTYSHDDNGGFRWTSPLGRVYDTHPPGRQLN